MGPLFRCHRHGITRLVVVEDKATGAQDGLTFVRRKMLLDDGIVHFDGPIFGIVWMCENIL